MNQLTQEFNKQRYKQRAKALLLVAPLLVFIVVFFVMPIGNMLLRSFYNDTVVQMIPQTTKNLQQWLPGDGIPDKQTLRVLMQELQHLAQQRLSGKLAENVNRVLPSLGSVIKKTARKLNTPAIDTYENPHDTLLAINKRWGKIDVYAAIKQASDTYTIDYYANALDMRLDMHGDIVAQPEGRQIYVKVLLRTMFISLLITLLTIMLGYPLAYYLSSLTDATANVLFICVLLPFWTSLLVRTTAWIAILQGQGVLNGLLQSIGVIGMPLELLNTQYAVIIGMVHILLPFMILPIYSVMKNIDLNYVMASQSLGANGITTFLKVYLPMTLPGLSAGSVLVFIIAIGYYITPALLGGVDGIMISNLIADNMARFNNWDLASALGAMLLAIILLLYWLYDRLVGVSRISLG